jgi:hypothetical protein
MAATKEALEPKGLLALTHPRDISYYIGSMFGDSRIEQQYLLEMNSTKVRDLINKI